MSDIPYPSGFQRQIDDLGRRMDRECEDMRTRIEDRARGLSRRLETVESQQVYVTVARIEERQTASLKEQERQGRVLDILAEKVERDFEALDKRVENLEMETIGAKRTKLSWKSGLGIAGAVLIGGVTIAGIVFQAIQAFGG